MRAPLKAFCLALALALPTAAPAQWGDTVALSLDVRRDRMDLVYPDERFSTRTTRLGVTLFEPSLSYLQPGLQVGQLWTTQSGNPATAGMDLTGHYIGLTLRSDWLLAPPLGLHGRVSYTYLEGDDTEAEQTTRLRWTEAEAALGLSLSAGPLQLQGGGYLRQVDGDEIASGPVTTGTRSFDLERHGGGYLELLYWTDATGSISARFEQGAARGFELGFARRF